MLHIIQRLLISWLVIISLLLLVSYDADAQNLLAGDDTHAYGAEALSHCQSAASACAAQLGGGVWAALPCVEGNWSRDYAYQVYPSRVSNSGSGSYQCNVPAIRNHTFPDGVYDPPCTATNGDQIDGYWGTYHGTNEAPASVCSGNCQYDYTVGPTHDCTNDVTDPSLFECASAYTYSGSGCSGGDTVDGEHYGNESGDGDGAGGYDCTNVDCGPNPPPGGGSGDSGGGGTVPGQDGGNTNPTPTPGDTNPDTPGGSGSGYGGSGDIDGDGDRDIDCNPQSNPDCGFTGSGTGSGDCDSQPTCSGDPVQCAQLYQIWATMCFDGGSFTNPSDCTIAITCEGDVLECESLRQARQQYCDTWVGDGNTDMDVTNDVDFERDLKDEAQTIDLPTAFDQTSVGGGDGGSCPDDIVIGLSYGNVPISMGPICSLAPTISIFVIISALIGAAYIVIVGRGKRNSG